MVSWIVAHMQFIFTDLLSQYYYTWTSYRYINILISTSFCFVLNSLQYGDRYDMKSDIVVVFYDHLFTKNDMIVLK